MHHLMTNSIPKLLVEITWYAVWPKHLQRIHILNYIFDFLIAWNLTKPHIFILKIFSIKRVSRSAKISTLFDLKSWPKIVIEIQSSWIPTLLPYSFLPFYVPNVILLPPYDKEAWKSRIFRSPSFSHSSVDFCFQINSIFPSALTLPLPRRLVLVVVFESKKVYFF